MRDSWLVEGCQIEQMGGDRALPEETNYQKFVSKTNILQSNHIVQSLPHCSVCMCVYCISDNGLDQLTCDGRHWISSWAIIAVNFSLALSFCS